MVVLVVLVLLSFFTALVWVRKHRTRERRSIVNVSCICDMLEDPFRPVLWEAVGPATKALSE
jgi:hypothetical protein